MIDLIKSISDPANNLVRDRRHLLVLVPSCVVASALVTFIMQRKLITRQKAVQICQQLVDADVMHHVTYDQQGFVDANVLYRFGRRYNCVPKRHRSKTLTQTSELPIQSASKFCQICGSARSSNTTPDPVQSPLEPPTTTTPLDRASSEADDEMAVWSCSICTYLNNPSEPLTLTTAPPPPIITPRSQSFSETFRKIFTKSSTTVNTAEIVRAAIRDAVLKHATSDELLPFSMLLLHDFQAIDRSMRPNNDDDSLTEGLRSDYAPAVCRAIRTHFKITDDDFCSSLIDFPLKARANSGGKSDAVFFFSTDKHYVVKSMSKEELSLLRFMLPQLVEHYRAHPHTLLPRVFGLYKISFGTRPQDVIRLMVINNVFDTNLSVDVIYDLKGSTARRFITPQEQQKALQSSGKLPVLKDMNWKAPLNLSSEDRCALAEQIEIDAKFLSRMGIMDYSLLIGIHEKPCTTAPEQTSAAYRSKFQQYFGGLKSTGVCIGNSASTKESMVYFVSIIDVLQQYNAQKQLERFVKTKLIVPLTIVTGKSFEDLECRQCQAKFRVATPPPTTQMIRFTIACPIGHLFDHVFENSAKADTNISCVNPETYLIRFLEFVNGSVINVNQAPVSLSQPVIPEIPRVVGTYVPAPPGVVPTQLMFTPQQPQQPQPVQQTLQRPNSAQLVYQYELIPEQTQTQLPPTNPFKRSNFQ
eukprot:c9252_g1_i1.p1 GENE.c9252_g1_i1~~c9252_g1_i1.p1  ORF type:complete len:698 (+),score=132.85 c9252_g1_i1:235-2328(+)